jgi:prepilin-type processing-associated H-X9-DG protein
MSTAASIQAAGGKFARSMDIYSCPTSKKPFIGNPGISSVNESAITDSATTIMFYESDCVHLEGCNVAYVDGHVKWLPESMWQAEKQRAGIL